MAKNQLCNHRTTAKRESPLRKKETEAIRPLVEKKGSTIRIKKVKCGAKEQAPQSIRLVRKTKKSNATKVCAKQADDACCN